MVRSGGEEACAVGKGEEDDDADTGSMYDLFFGDSDEEMDDKVTQLSCPALR